MPVIYLFMMAFCHATSTMTQVPSQFDLNQYNNTCEGMGNSTSNSCKPCIEFDVIIRTAMKFACTADAITAKHTVVLSAAYINKWYRDLNFRVRSSVNRVKLVRQFTLEYARMTLNYIQLEELANETALLYKTQDFYHLEKTREQIENKTKQLVYTLDNYAVSAWVLSNETERHGLSNIFLTQLYRSELLNYSKFYKLRDDANVSVPTERAVVLQNLAIFVVWPSIMGVMFIVGIASNGLLLFIFLRHSELRTVHNIMMINLVVVDMISIVINLPLNYFLYSRHWEYGLPLCQSFLFLNTLTRGVSTYTVVIISFQRKQAVSQFSTSRTSLLSSILTALGLWTIVIMYSSTGIFLSKTDFKICAYEKNVLIYYSYVELLIFCIIPAILVTTFSLKTSILLKKSAKNMPGEQMGQERTIRNRIVTSKVLIGFVALFVISYIPGYLFSIIIFHTDLYNLFYDVGNENKGFYFIIAFIFTSMLYVNSIMNPIVLYFLSTKFKKYFNNYLTCRCSPKV